MRQPIVIMPGTVGFTLLPLDSYMYCCYIKIYRSFISCSRDGKINESESITELSLSYNYQSKLSKTGSNRVNYVCTCPVQSLHMLS